MSAGATSDGDVGAGAGAAAVLHEDAGGGAVSDAGAGAGEGSVTGGSGDPRDDVYRVAALLWQLERFLDPTPQASPTAVRVEGDLPPRLPPTGTALAASGATRPAWMEAPPRRPPRLRLAPSGVAWVEPADPAGRDPGEGSGVQERSRGRAPVAPPAAAGPDRASGGTGRRVPAPVGGPTAPPPPTPPRPAPLMSPPATPTPPPLGRRSPPGPAPSSAEPPIAPEGPAAPVPPPGGVTAAPAPPAPSVPGPPVPSPPAQALPAQAPPAPPASARDLPSDARRGEPRPVGATSAGTAASEARPRAAGDAGAPAARPPAVVPPGPAEPAPPGHDRLSPRPDAAPRAEPGADGGSTASRPVPRAVLVEARGVVPTDDELARPTTDPGGRLGDLDDDGPTADPPPHPTSSQVRGRRRGVPAAALSPVEARRLEEELRRRFLDRRSR